MLPIPHGVNLTYKIDHIFVMTYHRPLSLVSFKSFFTIAVSSQGKFYAKYLICIFVNFNLNFKMAKTSYKKPHKNVFLTQAIIVAHSLYTSDTIWQLGLFKNYLICIFIIINIINYEKFGKSLKNKMYTKSYIITSVWHVNRPRMIKVVAA